MRNLRLAFARRSFARLTCAALLCGACSTTPGIAVVATPQPLAGDGKTVLTVTATPTEGGSASTSATVHFKTSLGTWDGATGTGDQIDVQSDGEGKAIATMSAPRQGFGTIQITASVSLQGKEPSASVSVPLVPAGGAATSLSFVCQHQNIGGLVHGRLTDIHVLCRATAVDAAGHAIPNASVQTLSEAGTLTWARDSASVQEFVYTVRPDDVPPKDVGPFDANGKELDQCPSACNADPFGSACAAGEPCYTDATNITHNPRDGVATLVAAVPGVKSFDNVGEPFVDMNDNGVRDPGEPFIDYNGNGKYDPGDGTLKEHMIWKAFRMIWSGEASVSATGSTTHDVFLRFAKTSATAGTLSLRLFDRNLNQLAADGASASDGIVWSSRNCANGGTLSFGTDTQIMEQIDPGILFSADAPGGISAPGLRSTWTRQTDYSNSATISAAPDSCGVSAGPQRVYDPGAIDFTSDGSNPDAAILGSATF